MTNSVPFDIVESNWIEWQENSIPVKQERIVYVTPNMDGSFSSRIWVRKDS